MFQFGPFFWPDAERFAQGSPDKIDRNLRHRPSIRPIRRRTEKPATVRPGGPFRLRNFRNNMKFVSGSYLGPPGCDPT